MTTYSDKFTTVATRLEGLNGEAVTRNPSDGSGPIALTAFAFVQTREERRFDEQGSERVYRVGNIRLAPGTTVLDDDSWEINGEEWRTVLIVHKVPSIRVFVERPAQRTVGGPELTEFAS